MQPDERVTGIRASITRWISDDPQPGIVECEFMDVHGRRHRFVEKAAVVTAEDIGRTTEYPQPGVIACTVVDRPRSHSGQKSVVANTENPWHMESTDGLASFEVLPSALVEWELGRGNAGPWNGVA